MQFKVFPNPFGEYLNFENNGKLIRLTITNIIGRREIDIQYPERVIDTLNPGSGIYVITLFTEEGVVGTETMVKK